MCFAPQRRALFWNPNLQKWREHVVWFVHFDLEMCFAPRRRALFPHLNFQKWSKRAMFLTLSLRNMLHATAACAFSTAHRPKVLRSWGALYILTSTSKMRFAPQWRVRFQELNVHKCSEPKVSLTLFWLQHLLRATAACNFWSLIRPDGSAPAGGPTFRPSGATK